MAHSQRSLASQVVETWDDLLEQVEQRCVQRLNLTDFIPVLTEFQWWKAFQC
ncbi:hypothetical protein [Nodosilinea sp. E11]|uniref:hypothetical protein n=1 Tax=Nodosilinea sp. E11 TaxID=3037479 RepID=UPI0029345D60|nr:hypothetical protein [Nodosilinea sp. E11]WOD37394.1 hypothetical protein RRF56_02715 [Nodosilinea sp. E11]